MMLILVVGCASAWVTPTVPAGKETPTPSAGNPGSVIPTPPAPSKPAPTATDFSAKVVLTDAPVQHWSDPNDARELLHDGTHLWVGTPGGLVRWASDGTYEIYATEDGLASDAIRGVAQDGDGHLWVGYADQEGWSELTEGAWHTYATREEAVEARYEAMLSAPRFNPRLWSSREGSSWLWLPTAEGTVQAYDGETWHAYGERQGITDDTWLVTVSPQGRVWAVGQGVSTTEEGMRTWEDHTFFSSVMNSRCVTDAAADEKGLWLTFRTGDGGSGGACHLAAGSQKWQGYLHELNQAIPSEVYDVRIDEENTVWLCGAGGLSYRKEGKPWEALPLDDMPLQGYVQDAESTLWLGTRRGIWHAQLIAVDGATQLDTTSHREIRSLQGPWRIPSPLLDNNVHALAMDSVGGLWIGTDGGLSHVNAKGETSTVSEEGVCALAVDENDAVWLATTEGLYHLQRDTLEQVNEKVIEQITLDADGRPWIYT
ncbi:MAG: two-component regulator propeller domain-containing protein, partial [Chloroflexota bacterium]|nr:two-component regulator propeller domain-containing protein [Chloroflexota bacterium]